MDAIVGDWLSENVMTGYGAGKAQRVTTEVDVSLLSLAERKQTAQYASTFLQCFEPAVHDLARNNTKLAVNAGASDTKLLAEVCQEMIQKAGYNMKVAWVEGDDVAEPFKKNGRRWDAFYKSYRWAGH